MAHTSQELFSLAKTFLNQPATIQDVDLLIEIIRWSDQLYYEQSEPLLADSEYDALFAQLKHLEKQNPHIKKIDSPTQAISQPKNVRLQSKPHAVPMLSLDNTYNAQDLITWDQRCKNTLKEKSFHYCVEPKYDGASISITYDSGKFKQALTRGDGLSGEDVTFNISRIKSLPHSLPSSALSHFEVRGEVVFNKVEFAKLNALRQQEGLSLLATPRNAASGTLRILDAHEAGKRKLDIILYHLADAESEVGKSLPFKSQTEALKWLSEQGLPTPEELVMRFKNIEDVITYCEQFEERRDNLPFEIDGMVVKVDEFEVQELLGMTAHHPRWAVAFKFKARQATTTLERVEFQVGRTGNIAPVAKIKPVNIGGVTITSVSLFNEDVIREKNLRIGDQILVERAGDVIPYIVKSFVELRKGNEELIKFPTHCPVCKEQLERQEDEAAWRCVNINCEAQVVERIIHFASKDAMDIRGLGESLIRKFYAHHFISDIPSIYELPFEQLKRMEGLGKKSIDNLEAAIANSKKQPLYRLIFGLGIRHIGETMSKTLARNINTMSDIYKLTYDDLIRFEDVGPKVAQSITQFFSHEENKKIISRLEEYGVNTSQGTTSTSAENGSWAGISFLFTGTLSQLKRGDAEEKVEAAGGKILSGVSSKLNYLVVGEDAGSKLEKAKKMNTVKIISEAEFLKMLKEIGIETT